MRICPNAMPVSNIGQEYQPSQIPTPAASFTSPGPSPVSEAMKMLVAEEQGKK